ncbi:MAG: hypothetical protein HFJ17_04485, partial [Clostridia bacterium]|nr:hypothetical protein [Clostridia bacterium]
MFNVTVIRLKDIIKYPVVISIMLIVIYCSTRYFQKNSKLEKEKINLGSKIKSGFSKHILYPIDEQMPIVQGIYEVGESNSNEKEKIIDENIEDADKDFTSYMLDTSFNLQFGIVNAKKSEKENINVVEENNERTDDKENKEEKDVTLASNNEDSKVVTKNPIAEKYTNTYKGVKIRNGTEYKLTDNILDPKSLNINNEKILIFHTHTCESYTQSDNYKYKASGNFRTTDLKYSVARVGDELTTYLSKYKFNVTHDKTYHDYPAYNGSYNRSLSTVSNILKNNKSDIIIDLHRDAIGSN